MLCFAIYAKTIKFRPQNTASAYLTPIRYNDDVFQSKQEFLSRMTKVKKNPEMLDLALTKSKSYAGEKEYRLCGCLQTDLTK